LSLRKIRIAKADLANALIIPEGVPEQKAHSL